MHTLGLKTFCSLKNSVAFQLGSLYYQTAVTTLHALMCNIKGLVCSCDRGEDTYASYVCVTERLIRAQTDGGTLTSTYTYMYTHVHT